MTGRAGRRRPLPLTASLIVMLTVLTSLVLLACGVALTDRLNSFLVSRLDEQLAQTAQVAATLFSSDVDDDHPSSTGQNNGLPAGSVAADVSLKRGARIVTGSQGPVVSPEQLAAVVGAAPALGQPFSGLAGAEDYRWIVTSSEGRTVVAGVPLDSVEATVGQLLALLAIIGVLAVISVALGGYLIVRRGLRPLGRLTAGARAIALSDLGSPGEAGRTRLSLGKERSSAEVADLSAALSAMLIEIDQSIESRDAANEQLRRFVADASHELRTPLASIRAYSELLRRGMHSDPAQPALFLDRIEAESVRLGTLVDDLLLLARLDQGRALAREPVDILAIIDDAVSDLEASDPGRPTEVVVADGTTPIIIGDPDRLRQVLGNLLANVRVHTPSDAAMTIRVENLEEDLVIDVADLGPGIPPEALGSVFDRFARADSSRSRDRGGAGLGLAIVKSIVEAHGGSVAVQSSASGTSVRISLPSGAVAPTEDQMIDETVA